MVSNAVDGADCLDRRASRLEPGLFERAIIGQVANEIAHARPILLDQPPRHADDDNIIVIERSMLSPQAFCLSLESVGVQRGFGGGTEIWACWRSPAAPSAKPQALHFACSAPFFD